MLSLTRKHNKTIKGKNYSIFPLPRYERGYNFLYPDFELKESGASSEDWVVALVNGDAELLLTSLEGNKKSVLLQICG